MEIHEEFQQSSPIEIEGWEGIKLKQLFIEDAQAYFELIEYDRAHLSQFNGETAENYPDVAAVIRSITNPENPDKLRFGIWDGDQMVGSINLTPKQNQIAEIGYWIGKQHTGHAFAAKAAQSLSEHAFEGLGYDTVFAHVIVGNEASKRTLLNSGFKFTKLFSEERNGKTVWLWKFEKSKKDPNNDN